jgi:hypothetical protein
MRHLTTVRGSFHGRVVAARLGTEGILVELRGMSEGPYPLQGAVEVFVSADQLELAREILLADEVDAAVDAELIEADLARSAGVASPPLVTVTPLGVPAELAAPGGETWPSGRAGAGHARLRGFVVAGVVALVIALVIAGILAGG